jgi:hypothetical protein
VGGNVTECIELRDHLVIKIAHRIEPPIEQVPGHHVAQRANHRRLHVRVLALELEDQSFDALSLETQIAASRTTAANDREIVLARVGTGFCLGCVNEWPDHDVRTVIRHEARRHGLERAGEEQVEENGFDEIVQMVAKRNLGGADILRKAVQHTAPQPRAQRARRRIRV